MNCHWNRVSRSEPCPICGCPENCTVSADGNAVWCGRVDAGSKRQNDGGQFLHFVGTTDDGTVRFESPPRASSPAAVRDWESVSEVAYGHPDAARKRENLAGTLGVTLGSLELLRVGWTTGTGKQFYYTFPERDAAGGITGIIRRFSDGRKRMMSGGNRGLTYVANWRDYEGPVMLPEGASCTAALVSLGLCAIGRPSNIGGTGLLSELLRTVPDDKAILVVGENDRKVDHELSQSVRNRHGVCCEGCSLCWPGLHGAEATARKLMELLDRDVAWAFPPDDMKDCRDWLRRRQGG